MTVIPYVKRTASPAPDGTIGLTDVTRDHAQRELEETARALLEAMRAGERMATLDPQASLDESERAREEADRLKAQAMARFKVMCGRLAIHAKGGLHSA
jgi:hypothetical protein